MSQQKKAIESFRKRPYLKSIRFEEAETLLLGLGFNIVKNGGSHVKYRHEKLSKHIRIPKKEYVKTYTIDDVCEALDYLEVEKDV